MRCARDGLACLPPRLLTPSLLRRHAQPAQRRASILTFGRGRALPQAAAGALGVRAWVGRKWVARRQTRWHPPAHLSAPIPSCIQEGERGEREERFYAHVERVRAQQLQHCDADTTVDAPREAATAAGAEAGCSGRCTRGEEEAQLKALARWIPVSCECRTVCVVQMLS